MNKIFKKRLKRRRLLEERVVCHGTTQNCMDAHIDTSGPAVRLMNYLAAFSARPKEKTKTATVPPPQFESTGSFFGQTAPKKVGFFRRLFRKQS